MSRRGVHSSARDFWGWVLGGVLFLGISEWLRLTASTQSVEKVSPVYGRAGRMPKAPVIGAVLAMIITLRIVCCTAAGELLWMTLLSWCLAGRAKRGNGVCLSVSSLLACRNYL